MGGVAVVVAALIAAGCSSGPTGGFTSPVAVTPPAVPPSASIIAAASALVSAQPSAAASAVAAASALASGVAAGPNVDPCSLLTQAEVSTAIGVAAGPGTTAADPRQCTWLPAAPGPPGVQASVTVNAATTIAQLCTATSTSGSTPVSGVGDAACFAGVGGTGIATYMAVQKGPQIFTVAVVLPTGTPLPTIQDTEKTLALAIVPRL
jgi:hypothetical protein